MDYGAFLKSYRNGFIALVFQRAINFFRAGSSPFAKAVAALGSLPSVALSSAMVKAFSLYTTFKKNERIV